MTVSASAEDHDDITNTSTTDAARGNMALCLTDYTNNPLSHQWKCEQSGQKVQDVKDVTMSIYDVVTPAYEYEMSSHYPIA